MSGTLIDSPGPAWVVNAVRAIASSEVAIGQGAGAPYSGVGSLNAGAQDLANRTAFLNNNRVVDEANIAAIQAFLAKLAGTLSESTFDIPITDTVLGSLLVTVKFGLNLVGAPSQVTFPVPFRNVGLIVVVSEGAAGGSWASGQTTQHGTDSLTRFGYRAWAESWTGSGWIGGTISQSYIAIGF
jgi:hypothetical protein